jgi:hypothetical protein
MKRVVALALGGLLAMTLGSCTPGESADRASSTTTSGSVGVGSSTTALVTAVAVWEVDKVHPPTKKAVTFKALVTRLECSGGETGEVFKPTVLVKQDEIVVTFMAKPMPPADYTCPGNRPVSYVVDLGVSVGDKKLVDGACLDGNAASTSYCLNGPVRWP